MVVLIAAASGPSEPPQLVEFHRKLGVLADQTNGPFSLDAADGSLDWPTRGIYVFFSPDTDPTVDPPPEWTITRIGTVGDCANSTSTLWDRLRAHRGNTRGDYAGGGNHRGSVFRRHVGRAIIERDDLHDTYPYWGTPHAKLPDDLATADLRANEHPLEVRVSNRIRDLPFLVIDIPGDPGPDCERAQIEKNLIALVAHARRTNPNLRQDGWLGAHSPHAEIAKTGLWNIDHVNAFYTADIISMLDPHLSQTSSPTE